MQKKLCQMIFVAIILIGFVNQIQAESQEKISFVYLYGKNSELELMHRNDGAINVVSPSYFDLDEKGNLKMDEVNENLIMNLHKSDIQITPFLSNHWDRNMGRSAFQNIEQLTTDLVKAIEQNHFDGINIDIENLTEQDREDYVYFVKVLRQKIPTNKVISVAVAANPYGIRSGWQGSYDLKKLAPYVDYFVLMAYDEHYEGGSPGAVASIRFVKQTIENAILQVDKQKIVVGVPFYGRIWKEEGENGGTGITLRQVSKLLKTYPSIQKYDYESECMTALVQVVAENQKIRVNGKELTKGRYQVYYENEDSMAKKIEMIKDYQLRGIAAWSLGQETEEVWKSYASFLIDSSEDFDKGNQNAWASDAIDFVKQKGWMIGRESHLFAWDEKLTRAEFATIITRVLALDANQIVDDENYKDVSSHWAEKAILLVSKTGLMEGYPEDFFYPNQIISREEVAKVVSLMLKEGDDQIGIEFLDVERGRWSYPYIQKMVKNGIINGYEDETFKPQKGITRAEIAMILWRTFF